MKKVACIGDSILEEAIFNGTKELWNTCQKNDTTR